MKYGAPIFVPDSIPPENVVVPEIVKRLVPENVFESASNVVEAAAAPPSNVHIVPLQEKSPKSETASSVGPTDEPKFE